MNVIIVEPDKRLASNYALALTGHGHDVRTATSAQQAIHLTDEQVPDVILLELHLKKHNGVEFLYELRSYADWQDIPVIVLSFVQPEKFISDESFLQQLGVKEFLYKPGVSLQQVTAALSRVVRPLSI